MITRYFGDNYIEGFKIGGTINLSGATITLTVAKRKTPDLSDRVFQIVGNIIDVNTREVNFEYNNQEELTPVGVYYYEIEYTSALSEYQVLEEGDYVVIRGITK